MTGETLSGTILLDRYQLGALIGSGGMATVYHAVDTVSGTDVAVKILKSEYNGDVEFVRRFQREAIASQTMLHPNIIKVMDVGEQNGMRFIVMEHVDGITIKEIVAKEGALDPKRAIDYAVQTARAIEHAHRCHIIHRDIKSQNIMVDRRGIIKVADFGIARATNSATVTDSQEGVLGSVHYFSPEQAKGEVVDEKSDIYSLGVVIYEMITGRLPFEGELPITVALGHIQEMPEAPSTLNPAVPRALDEVVLKALNKNKHHRYRSAIQMELDLSMVLAHPEGGFVDDHARKEAKAPPRTETLKPLTLSGRQDALDGDEPDGLEARPERNQRTLKSALTITALFSGIALVVLLVVAFFWRDIAVVEYTSYNYIGVPYTEARQELENSGYTVIEFTTYSDDVQRGYVIEQEIRPNSKMGATAMLLVSSGPETVLVPDLSGMTEKQATDRLYSVGLDINVVYQPSATAAEDKVYQQEPSWGASLANASMVTVTVNTQPRLVTMPKLTGHTLEDAVTLLQADGIAYDIVYEEYTDVQAGTVIGQEPPEQQDMMTDQRAQIVVALAPQDIITKQEEVPVSLLVEGEVVIVYRDEDGGSIRLFGDRCPAGVRTFRFWLQGKAGSQGTISISVDKVHKESITVVFE